MATTVTVEDTFIDSARARVGALAVEQQNNFNNFTCKKLVKRMQHFVENPTTQRRSISDYIHSDTVQLVKSSKILWKISTKHNPRLKL